MREARALRVAGRRAREIEPEIPVAVVLLAIALSKLRARGVVSPLAELRLAEHASRAATTTAARCERAARRARRLPSCRWPRLRTRARATCSRRGTRSRRPPTRALTPSSAVAQTRRRTRAASSERADASSATPQKIAGERDGGHLPVPVDGRVRRGRRRTRRERGSDAGRRRAHRGIAATRGATQRAEVRARRCRVSASVSR